VVTLSGDGGLSMLLGDLLTLRQQGLPVKVVVFNNGSLSFVELEMKADGFVNFGTELDNPSFAAIGAAMGLHAVRIERPSELAAGLGAAFAHDGPALVEVMTARQELAIPPQITAAQAKGFTLWATRSILSGEGDAVVEVARTNLRQLAFD
jgi:pyruvate dehydrogenase (quinone)